MNTFVSHAHNVVHYTTDELPTVNGLFSVRAYCTGRQTAGWRNGNGTTRAAEPVACVRCLAREAKAAAKTAA